MGETSIPCREETRDRLRDDKTEGVSWDRYLNDLLDAANVAADVAADDDAVMERLEAIQERGPVTLEAGEYAKIADEVEGRMR